MLTKTSYYEFSLAAGEAVSLMQTAGWEIVCVGGRVWLTEELGGEDVWLAVGQRFALTRTGRTVIEADQAATVRMSCAARGVRRSPRLPPLLPGRRGTCPAAFSLSGET